MCFQASCRHAPHLFPPIIAERVAPHKDPEAGGAKAVDDLREEARASFMDSVLTGGLGQALTAAATQKTMDFAEEEGHEDFSHGFLVSVSAWHKFA